MKKFRWVAIILLAIMALQFTACGKKGTVEIQNNLKVINEKGIDGDRIISIIKELSSPKYAGRLVGTEGNKLTEDYIVDSFKKMGLETPDGIENYKQEYSQDVMIKNGKPTLQIIDKNGKVFKEFTYPKNFITSSISKSKIKGNITEMLVKLDSFKELKDNSGDFKNKIVLFSSKVRQEAGNNNEVMSVLSSSKAKGAIFEIDITDARNPYKHLPVSPFAETASRYDNENGPMVLYVENNTFKEISDAADNGMKLHMNLDLESKNEKASNVIGLIRGTDESLKNEYIIVSCHLDHVGDNKNGSYNPGALDNASGVGAMLEIARILKETNVSLKKSILFVAFNGEEEGLYGSYRFSLNPVCSLDKSVLINLDMVGSKNVMPLIIGSYDGIETELIKDIKKYARKLNIDCKMDKEDASDHTPLAQMGVEAVTLIHLDIENEAYHTPKDTWDSTIDKNRISDVVKLVLYYIINKGCN